MARKTKTNAKSETDEQTTAAWKAPKFLLWLSANLVVAIGQWFAPLQNGLFPEYFEPRPRAFAAIAMLTGTLGGLALYRKTAPIKMRRHFAIHLAVSFVALLSCFTAMNVFTTHLEPDASFETLIHVAWISAYAAIFFFLSLVLILGAYLSAGNDYRRPN